MALSLQQKLHIAFSIANQREQTPDTGSQPVMTPLARIYLWNTSYYFSSTSEVNFRVIYVSEKNFSFLIAQF